MTTKLFGYAAMISEATGETDPAELREIEDMMRNTIFHSTLDWQSKAQFNRGARDAVGVIAELRRLGLD